MEILQPYLDATIGVGLLVFLAFVTFAWFAGFVGYTFHMIALRRYLVPGYNLWKDLPLWQALLCGPGAIIFHPEYVVDEGRIHFEKARNYGRLLLIAIAATTLAAVVRIAFFGLEP